MSTEQNGVLDTPNSTLDKRLELDPVGHTIIGVYLCIVAVLGITGSSLVLITFWRKRQLLSPTYVIILALTVCDLLMSVAGTPFAAASSFGQKWLFGQTGCNWAAFITFVLGLSGLYLLAAISVDRYVIIVKPFSISQLTYKASFIMIGGCVGVSLLLSIMPLVGWSSFTLEGAYTSCSVNWKGRSPGDTSYIVTIFLLCFVLPVTVMTTCYISLYIEVRKVTHTLANALSSNSRVNENNSAMEMKLAKMIAVMLGAYLLSWTPYAIVSLWAAVGDPNSIPVLAAALPAVIAKSAVVWNPFIYLGMNKKFRQALFSILPFSCLNPVVAPVAPSRDAYKTTVG